MEQNRAILIAGPTASGKSALALAIAKSCGGTIINADSMQVYAELRILTARPMPADEEIAPHRLYGHVSVTQNYSVAAWLKDVEAAIRDVRAWGGTPIIIGGTGLYFMALTQGLSPVPSIPDDIRRYWRQAACERPAEELYQELCRRDPITAARLRESDRQRIVRAIEVYEATGTPLAHWQEKPGTPLLSPEEYVGLVVDLPREDLYARADARFAQMISEGALEEAVLMRSMQLDPDLPATRALGLAPLMACTAGEITLEEASEVTCRDTRHYIRRQLTWLRRNMISWKWMQTKEIEQIKGSGFSFVD